MGIEKKVLNISKNSIFISLKNSQNLNFSFSFIGFINIGFSLIFSHIFLNIDFSSSLFIDLYIFLLSITSLTLKFFIFS
jgi:hypothetical protein